MVDLETFHARRAAIIYNPVARGLARHQHLLQRTIGLLAQQGIDAILIPTIAPGTAGGQAKQQIEEGCDLILAAGGDGTINELVDGMLHTGVPLGILPGGTANVLAREVHLPIHIGRAASQISRLKSCSVAVGSISVDGAGARSFICMAGAGLDAEIVYRINLDLKAAAGKLAYYMGGFAQVFRPIYEFEVIVDGKRFEASFALITRVRNYGGDLEIARDASLMRDDFTVVLFRGKISARYLSYLVGVAAGQVHRMKGCTILRGHSVTCLAPPNQQIYAQIDGEFAGKLPVSAEIIPNALTLLLPPDYLARERSRASIPAYA
jgi:YegS/Rv2252/BmrU family lipid kinase